MSTVVTEKTAMPRSVLRHRPIASDIQEFVVQPRAGKGKPVSRTAGSPPPAPNKQVRSSFLQHAHPLLIIGLSMLITLLLLWVVQGILTWGSTQLDTLRYGYPRSLSLDRAVGHELGKTLSHFQAFNLQGQIYVLEIPGGNASAAQLLVGPHLFGPGADLAPVTLVFQGNPRSPDLLVQVHGIEARFHNTGKTYVPL
jgi:hypothetical protein